MSRPRSRLRRRQLILAVVFALCILPFAARRLGFWRSSDRDGRRGGPEIFLRTEQIMWTTVRVKIALDPAAGIDRKKAGRAAAAAFEAVRDVDRRMSSYKSESEISRLAALGAGEEMSISAPTLEVLSFSRELAEVSGGAFDVTVGPLVELYRGARREGRLPEEKKLTEARESVGWRLLRLDERSGTAALEKAGMRLDLGGVAKGFAVDRAAAALRAEGARRALVEAGGEYVAVGEKAPGRPWWVGIRHPRREDALWGVIELRPGEAVATSGDYEKFFVAGGKKYSHIVDPRTGRPLSGGAVSVTVLAPDCMTADGLATALSVRGRTGAEALLERFPGTSALVIEEDADGELRAWSSSGFRGRLLPPPEGSGRAASPPAE